ncbi:hypothetical protein B0H15DRAFT_951446 [Mycena belliarum]|uniref:Uncharacterized protein n=1 Tax=Mycena belliarum TaxID=1033014 RepID=A0AAD6TZA1_9AGAR|nr:hypothetical protein B0H15DRAFT_951446 [Mycena belliae]
MADRWPFSTGYKSGLVSRAPQLIMQFSTLALLLCACALTSAAPISGRDPSTADVSEVNIHAPWGDRITFLSSIGNGKKLRIQGTDTSVAIVDSDNTKLVTVEKM